MNQEEWKMLKAEHQSIETTIPFGCNYDKANGVLIFMNYKLML